jgi:predicted nucleotidyltransferase
MADSQVQLADYYAKKYPYTFTRGLLKQKRNPSQRFQLAWGLARTLSSILKDQFGATKVVVFGSLINADRFTERSDIDLAVWGIPDDKFFAAVGVITGLNADFKIDLVDVSSCRDSLRQSIEKEGIEI